MPPAWLAATIADVRSKERKTARALLAAETATLRDAKAAALAAHAQAASNILEDGGDSTRTVSHVKQGASAILAALILALSAGTRRAKVAARAHLGAAPKPPLADAHADHAFSELTANSVSSSWAGAASTGARLESVGQAEALRVARKRLTSSVERAVATETSLAFNREIVAATEEALRPPPSTETKTAPEPRYFLVWSAILDIKTCTECAALDGLTIPIGTSFPSGAPPLHPFCRCVVIHTTAPGDVEAKDFTRELKAAIRERN